MLKLETGMVVCATIKGTATRTASSFVGTVILLRGDFVKISNETKKRCFPAFTYVYRTDVFPVNKEGIVYGCSS